MRALRSLGYSLERVGVDAFMAERFEPYLLNPASLRLQLESALQPEVRRVLVNGALEGRVLLYERANGSWLVTELGERPLESVAWPEAIRQGLRLTTPGSFTSEAHLSETALYRLERPKLALVSLCHPETFPLPRFPLGISDLARAVRLRRQGTVSLFDMQLGLGMGCLKEEIQASEPDIVGISATFGQHDLAEELADFLYESSSRPLLVFGGSLSALNASRLIRRYPRAIVASGPGETTMQDVVAYWHAEKGLEDIRGARWAAGDQIGSSKGPPNGVARDFLPELDLLGAILDSGGVMQLESSRGCTHACSFCPREHKGVWAGGDAGAEAELLGALAAKYDRRPNLARKIFLVDEEFIGPEDEGKGVARALQVAETLAEHKFRWETSSRVDQIYRPDKSKAWHVERFALWSDLCRRGLDRCLFGVESGVDSILRRFNKRATAQQNALALRALSTCGVPIRSTYITFDPLMSRSELRASFGFQGRSDLLLQPRPDLTFGEIYDAIHDDEFARANSTGIPLFESITYPLVSMECLLGSPYLRKVEEAGLALDEVPAMGRRNALYRDPALGVVSDQAQRWIDRNFSLDYTLKSLEKITAGAERRALRPFRALLRASAYRLLGRFISCLGEDSPATELESLPLFTAALREAMEAQFTELVEATRDLFEQQKGALDDTTAARLLEQMETWNRRTGWGLIND